MDDQINKIKKSTEELRRQIVNHKVYSVIKGIEELRIFMKYHVFAVWDFMSLLKSLQQNLTCTSVPWFPRGSADNRYLINEIVLGEESDVDHTGERKSHFELYLEAMRQSGADCSQIENFIEVLKKTNDFGKAFSDSEAPAEVQDFVKFTFSVINSGKVYMQAGVFTFGREDLIPAMFHTMINDLGAQHPEEISIFKYYLDRHIEVDGGHHSHLALQMMTNLCGTNLLYWAETEEAIRTSLQKRIDLWDGIYEEIVHKS